MKNVFMYDELPEPLSKEEFVNLFHQMKIGNETAREKIISHNIKLVLYIVRHTFFNLENKEELVSIGLIGLINAVDNFDLNSGYEFSTFAGRVIENEIKMALRKKANVPEIISIYTPLYKPQDDTSFNVLDILTDEIDLEKMYLEKELYCKINEFINLLSEIDAKIINLYFGINGMKKLNQREISEILNINHSYVHRHLKYILEELKYYLYKQGLIEKNSVSKSVHKHILNK